MNSACWVHYKITITAQMPPTLVHVPPLWVVLVERSEEKKQKNKREIILDPREKKYLRNETKFFKDDSKNKYL